MHIFKVAFEKAGRIVPVKAETIDEIIATAVKKLNLPSSEYQVTLQDGLEIDDNEILMEMAENAKSRGEYIQLKLITPERSPSVSQEQVLLDERLRVIDPNDINDVLEIQEKLPPLPVDWREKVLSCINHSLSLACNSGLIADPRDRRYMVAGIADYMKSINNFHRKTAEIFATFIVQQFPDTFRDKIGEKIVGHGMESLRSSIYSALTHRKDTKDKNMKRKSDNSLNDDENSNSSRFHDEFGCVEYSPALPPEETAETQELKRNRLKEFYDVSNFKDVLIPVLIRDTYATQRSAINVDKDRNIEKIFEDWPFLNFPEKLVDHASRLLGIEIQTEWQESLSNAKFARKYFKQFCLDRNGKSKGTKQTEKINKIIKLLQESKKISSEGQSNTAKTIVVFRLLLAYFNEKEDLFLKVIAEDADEKCAKTEAAPHPTLIIRGKSIYDENSKFYVILEKKVLINVSNVLQGILITFISYYIFGYAYPPEIEKTLEYIQRDMLHINPQDNEEADNRKKPHDKRVKGAKRRRTTFDSCVLTLSKNITNFANTSLI